MPDDGSLAAEQLPSRDIVVKALALLRENYVFPELAGQAADEAYNVAYAKALRHVTELGDVPPPIADEARDTLATLEG